MIELVCVFEYYFDANGRNTPLKLIEGYIEAVGQLNFAHLGEGIVEIINKTILRTYNDGLDFWSDSITDAIENCLRFNNLLYIIILFDLNNFDYID